MPSLEISDHFMRRLQAFKPVSDAVLQEDSDWGAYVEMVLHIGLNEMLLHIIGQTDAALVTLKKLADLEPEMVFKLIALGWEKANEQERERARHSLEECKKSML